MTCSTGTVRAKAGASPLLALSERKAYSVFFPNSAISLRARINTTAFSKQRANNSSKN
jgi:hypothetical protein